MHRVYSPKLFMTAVQEKHTASTIVWDDQRGSQLTMNAVLRQCSIEFPCRNLLLLHRCRLQRIPGPGQCNGGDSVAQGVVVGRA